mmetsp:Transcript_3427/g.8540  ORF Transcript_3427/g.8540 Transcript_3427/m.8540 type:complete len:255 (+) Transcript_3427:658-1422(+)
MVVSMASSASCLRSASVRVSWLHLCAASVQLGCQARRTRQSLLVSGSCSLLASMRLRACTCACAAVRLSRPSVEGPASPSPPAPSCSAPAWLPGPPGMLPPAATARSFMTSRSKRACSAVSVGLACVHSSGSSTGSCAEGDAPPCSRAAAAYGRGSAYARPAACSHAMMRVSSVSGIAHSSLLGSASSSISPPSDSTSLGSSSMTTSCPCSLGATSSGSPSSHPSSNSLTRHLKQASSSTRTSGTSPAAARSGK